MEPLLMHSVIFAFIAIPIIIVYSYILMSWKKIKEIETNLKLLMDVSQKDVEKELNKISEGLDYSV